MRHSKELRVYGTQYTICNVQCCPFTDRSRRLCHFSVSRTSRKKISLPPPFTTITVRCKGEHTIAWNDMTWHGMPSVTSNVSSSLNELLTVSCFKTSLVVILCDERRCEKLRGIGQSFRCELAFSCYLLTEGELHLLLLHLYLYSHSYLLLLYNTVHGVQ